jgi:chondroitin AC lyase
MSRFVLPLFAGLLMCIVPSFVSAQKKDFQVVRDRIETTLWDKPVDAARIKKLAQSIREDGSWPDINYRDVSLTGFQHARHTANLVALGIAWRNPNSALYKSETVKSTIIRGLSFWLKHDFIADNWWHNQIGTPSDLADLMLLAGNELPKDLTEKAQPIISRGNLNATGARPSGDRIKIAGIAAKQALFLNDTAQFVKILKVIEGEIKFESGRGMQYDYSFHHREDRVNNTLSYGLQFANVFAEWADYVRGTRFAFDPGRIRILVDYYLDGICKMMVFGKYQDLGAKNRDVTRPGSAQIMGSETVEKLLAVTSYRKTELEQILRARENQNQTPSSFSKFFWLSEYYSHQRPGFFSSVRMHSNRTSNIEYPYNGEGLLNHHLGDGANYVYTRGTEYSGIFPVWDWQKIPGTTALQKPKLDTGKNVQKKGITTWTGGVTDGRYGAAVMDFVSPHDGTKAKKAWFFFDDQYVCLGNSIRSDSNYAVVTTLNQCLLNGPVLVDNGPKPVEVPRGSLFQEPVKWVWHDQIAYYFPEMTKVQMSTRDQTGSWSLINHQISISSEKISKPVFKLWIDHGKRPADAGYAYIVLPGLQAQQVAGRITRAGVEILENSASIQAVSAKNPDFVQAFFYKAGELKFKDIRIAARSPIAIMIQLNKGKVKALSVADPGRKLGEVQIVLNAQLNSKSDKAKIKWDSQSGTSLITVGLPQGDFAGQTVSVRFSEEKY